MANDSDQVSCDLLSFGFYRNLIYLKMFEI